MKARHEQSSSSFISDPSPRADAWVSNWRGPNWIPQQIAEFHIGDPARLFLGLLENVKTKKKKKKLEMLVCGYECRKVCLEDHRSFDQKNVVLKNKVLCKFWFVAEKNAARCV